MVNFTFIASRPASPPPATTALRVKEWVRKACKVEHFPDLSPVQFERLMLKLKQWHDDEAQRLAYELAAATDAMTDVDPCPI